MKKFRCDKNSCIHELESKIAPWPHTRLLIQIFEGGGMEYHGATSSGIEDLRHELIHRYFARGVMSLDGKSSWIDEDSVRKQHRLRA